MVFNKYLISFVIVLAITSALIFTDPLNVKQKPVDNVREQAAAAANDNILAADKEIVGEEKEVIVSLEETPLELRLQKKVCFEDGHCEIAFDYFSKKIANGDNIIKIKGLLTMQRNFPHVQCVDNGCESTGTEYELPPSFALSRFWVIPPTEEINGTTWRVLDDDFKLAAGKNVLVTAEFNPYPNISEWLYMFDSAVVPVHAKKLEVVEIEEERESNGQISSEEMEEAIEQLRQELNITTGPYIEPTVITEIEKNGSAYVGIMFRLGEIEETYHRYIEEINSSLTENEFHSIEIKGMGRGFRAVISKEGINKLKGNPLILQIRLVRT